MKRTEKGMWMAFVVLFVLASAPSWGQARVTFEKDVLPIFQDQCQGCHRPSGQNVSGMIAPMSLMTYKEVRPWAKSIAKSIKTKAMPPWMASSEFNGVFKHERVMTDEQIETILSWVKAGGPRGNPKDAPPPIDWPESGWTIGEGEPDLIVAFDKPNWVGDEVDDLYQNITVRIPESAHAKDRWIRQVEFKPGSEVVHHIIAYQATPSASGAMSAGMIGGEAPGTDPSTFPDGYGILLPKAPVVTFQMHYHKERGAGTGVWDESSFALKFHDKPVTHPLQVSSINHGAFEIPPNNPRWKVGGARTFRQDTTITGFMPHLHLRGVAARYTAFYPDGTSEVLLDVPNYDFNWQIAYDYKDEGLKKIPAGTRIEFEMWYDNSPERGSIGFNSNRPVAFGGPTWDEMDLGWMSHTPTAPSLSGASE